METEPWPTKTVQKYSMQTMRIIGSRPQLRQFTLALSIVSSASWGISPAPGKPLLVLHTLRSRPIDGSQRIGRSLLVFDLTSRQLILYGSRRGLPATLDTAHILLN